MTELFLQLVGEFLLPKRKQLETIIVVFSTKLRKQVERKIEKYVFFKLEENMRCIM